MILSLSLIILSISIVGLVLLLCAFRLDTQPPLMVNPCCPLDRRQHTRYYPKKSTGLWIVLPTGESFNGWLINYSQTGLFIGCYSSSRRLATTESCLIKFRADSLDFPGIPIKITRFQIDKGYGISLIGAKVSNNVDTVNYLENSNEAVPYK